MIAQRLYYGHGTYSKDNDANEYTTSDLGLPEWGLAHSNDRRQDDSWWLAEYRNTCTANSWAGFVLAAQIMQSGSSAKTLWNHNVLFDYMDSYMKTEADAGRTGTWNRQWDTWTEKMWDTYRANYGSIWAAPGSSNKPPNADAGPDQTSAASATSGTALVTLNGSHSSSSNGSIVSYVWAERGGQIAAVATPSIQSRCRLQTTADLPILIRLSLQSRK
jgi:hypothetical protein